MTYLERSEKFAFQAEGLLEDAAGLSSMHYSQGIIGRAEVCAKLAHYWLLRHLYDEPPESNTPSQP